MEFCGVICEFNPFHNGHKFLFDEIKARTGCEIVCLMSGDFVQRGEMAIESKFERAKKAIMAGAAMVIELPTVFACSNAENFSSGAIRILKHLNIKKLAFGVENASLEMLQAVAKLKAENSEEFQLAFHNEIENGINFNAALRRAIIQKLPEAEQLICSPNNILAVEYLTAIITQKAHITPLAIERSDNGYQSKTAHGKFLSASSIRELIMEGKDVSRFVPYEIHRTLGAEQKLECLQIMSLRKSSAAALEKCYDMSEGIEFRIKEMSDKFATINEIAENVSTARYRRARVNKLLLYPLLEITKQKVKLSKRRLPAVRVLAVSKNNKQVLSAFAKSKLPLVVTNDDYNKLSAAQKIIMDTDFLASEIFRTIEGSEKNDKKMGTMFV